MNTMAAKMTKARNTKPKRRERSEMKGRLGSFLMFLPNMLALLGRLLKDNRVPLRKSTVRSRDRLRLLAARFIADVFPFIGQVDDLYVVALVFTIDQPDGGIDRSRHWHGGGDIVSRQSP